MKKSWPEPELESPIPFQTGSNGEFVPRRRTRLDRIAEDRFKRVVDDRSRKLAMTRRDYIKSSCGVAAALLVINQTYGCGSNNGGGFAVDARSTLDAAKACEELTGNEFVFDVQTHHVNPDGGWRAEQTLWPLILQSFPQASCGESDPIRCYDTNHYIRELFINSDTAIAVLSAVPAVPEENPLLVEEQTATRELVEMLSGSPRLLTHGLVIPDRGEAELDGMQRLVENQQIAAWKVYTQFGGWWLDDPQTGIPFIEKARSLGVTTICAHKGLTLPGFDGNFSSPADIGRVAPQYSDVNFIVYHSGYETDVTEGPYNAANPLGVDQLIKALEDNSIAPNSNVFAELGSTWRSVMTSPIEASHVLGKLLKHVGEDNILWGTDSIWYGSPQDQIQAFRTFQIDPQIAAANQYPELTPTRREKILGLNAAQLYGLDPAALLCEINEDDLTARRLELPDRPVPSFNKYGPSTRREFFAFLRSRGGMPG